MTHAVGSSIQRLHAWTHQSRPCHSPCWSVPPGRWARTVFAALCDASVHVMSQDTVVVERGHSVEGRERDRVGRSVEQGQTAAQRGRLYTRFQLIQAREHTPSRWLDGSIGALLVFEKRSVFENQVVSKGVLLLLYVAATVHLRALRRAALSRQCM